MNALFDLTGRRALVTGGGSGIGLAAARGLAEHGAQVTIWGRSPERLAAAAATFDGSSSVDSAVVDVSDEDAVVAGMQAVEAGGGLDVLVVNAGLSAPPTALVDTSRDIVDRVLGTNLLGAFWTMREAARTMIGRPGRVSRSIIVVSSPAALAGAASNATYGASKAGLLALANAAAVELARHDIRVNTILPGWTATEMSADLQASQVFTDKVISRVPQRRWASPDEFKGPVVYLASDASRFQTGSSTMIDGGYSIF